MRLMLLSTCRDGIRHGRSRAAQHLRHSHRARTAAV